MMDKNIKNGEVVYSQPEIDIINVEAAESFLTTPSGGGASTGTGEVEPLDPWTE